MVDSSVKFVMMMGRLISVIAAPRKQTKDFHRAKCFRKKEILKYRWPELLESLCPQFRVRLEAFAPPLLPGRNDPLYKGAHFGNIGRPGRVLTFVHRRVPSFETWLCPPPRFPANRKPFAKVKGIEDTQFACFA
jgi:hypothetical protein